MNFIPPAEYYKTLPTKRIAGIVFYPCPENKILLVEPTYLKKLIMPGGVVEKDESPFAAAQRESIEELGFEKVTKQLLVVIYTKPIEYKTEALYFIFKGETLTQNEINSIQPKEGELKSIKILALDEAQSSASKIISDMLPHAVNSLKTSSTYYLETTTEL